jgi:hypothetical protein
MVPSGREGPLSPRSSTRNHNCDVRIPVFYAEQTQSARRSPPGRVSRPGSRGRTREGQVLNAGQTPVLGNPVPTSQLCRLARGRGEGSCHGQPCLPPRHRHTAGLSSWQRCPEDSVRSDASPPFEPPGGDVVDTCRRRGPPPALSRSDRWTGIRCQWPWGTCHPRRRPSGPPSARAARRATVM